MFKVQKVPELVQDAFFVVFFEDTKHRTFLPGSRAVILYTFAEASPTGCPETYLGENLRGIVRNAIPVLTMPG